MGMVSLQKKGSVQNLTLGERWYKQKPQKGLDLGQRPEVLEKQMLGQKTESRVPG